MSASKREKLDQHADQLALLFKALSDPARVRILGSVAKTDACVSELCNALNMSQSSVSHHLAQLRARQLVVTRRAGREIFYALADKSILDILEAAKRHVESD